MQYQGYLMPQQPYPTTNRQYVQHIQNSRFNITNNVVNNQQLKFNQIPIQTNIQQPFMQSANYIQQSVIPQYSTIPVQTSPVQNYSYVHSARQTINPTVTNVQNNRSIQHSVQQKSYQQIPSNANIQPVSNKIIEEHGVKVTQQTFQEPRQEFKIPDNAPSPVIDENVNTIETTFERPVYINREITVENPVQRVINKVIEVDMPIDYVHHRIQQVQNEQQIERTVQVRNTKIYEKIELFEDKDKIAQLEAEVQRLMKQIQQNNKLIVEYGLTPQDYYNEQENKPIQQQFYPETSQYLHVSTQQEQLQNSTKRSYIPKYAN